MDSLSMNHVHSALCNYGLGASFGTPKTAGSTANRTYTPSTVQFGAAMDHDHRDDFARINSSNPFSAESKMKFGATSSGWVPFGSAQKSSNRLSLMA